MTYKFKLSRRLACLRASLVVLAVALSGCDNSRSLEPDPSDAGQGPTTDNTLAAASFAGGIPIGIFAQPTSDFGPRFNGAHRNIGPHVLLQELAAIKARGGRVVLMFAGTQSYYKEGGHFSLAKWKARVNRFKDVNFSGYIKDGTVIGHYLLDEPDDPANWNQRLVPPSVVEEMAQYSKQLWPDLTTIVRAEPGYLARDHRYLDAAWAQYLHRKGPVEDFIRRNVADAQERRLGLVVGLNIIHGGPGKTKMSASQVESWGSALLGSTYPCAFISWQYDAGYLSSSSMKSAMDVLRRRAENRSARTCRGTASSGGGTPPEPPPSEPPPSEPPPSEPPPTSPSAGVPFGPYGLPTSEMDAFTGSIRGATPGNVLATVVAARQAGAKVILRLTNGDVTNADGTFSLTKWKAAVDRYGSVNLSSYVNDGTIAGHVLVLSPQTAKAWGGRQISHATLEEMARYSRERWPALPTIAHASTSWLAGKSTPWQYLDAASVTYSGAVGDAGAWVTQQASAAGRARLGLLVGMNVLNGGTSASRLAGTTRGKFAMSASQLQSWGSALVANSRVCGLVMSRYDAGYFGRSDVRSAVASLAGKARARSATSCRAET